MLPYKYELKRGNNVLKGIIHPYDHKDADENYKLPIL